MIQIALLLIASQAPDTTATKASLLAADRMLARNSLSLTAALEPGAAVLLPDQPVIQGEPQLPPMTFTWFPQHAVASSDGTLGCTAGVTRAEPAAAPNGRYLTCWRLGPRSTWRIVAHARTGGATGTPAPDSILVAPPHSATGSGNDLNQVLVTDALFSRFALDSGPAAGFARYVAEDGMLLGAAPTPRRGPQQMRVGFAQFPADRRLMWTPARNLGMAAGGLAVTVGTAAVGSSKGGAENSPSKYLTVWRQEPDGSWKFVFDLGSDRPANTPADGHFSTVVRLQARLDSLHAAGRFPGATFGVVLPDGAVIGVATGMSDTARRLIMQPSDLMPQGSVGKTYVSALAMQLVHEGKLDLGAPISRYLGQESWFSRLPNAADITVRQLMNHTSGLVRYEFSEKFGADLTAAPADKAWDPKEQIAYIFDSPPPFKAGEGWQYSDTNYMVLGLITETLTGRPMMAEIQRRFVVANRLTQTAANLGPVVPGVVQGYAGPRNAFGGADAMLTDGRFGINPQFEWAGGGWSSSTTDLARWGKILYEWKAFDSSLSGRFLDGVPARLGANARYGLGVIIWPDTPLGQAIGHSGFFPGYQTELRYFPDRKLAVAFQVNASSGRALPRGMNGAILELAQVVAEAEATP